MRIGRHIVTLALLAGAMYGGIRYETAKVQQTCEDEHAVTELNGEQYVCLTMQQARELRQALHSRSST